MRTMNIEKFIEQHGNETFKYSDELFEGLDNESWDVTSYTGGEKNTMKAEAFKDIYGKKAKNLNQKDDDYSKMLQNDLIDFCKTMDELGDEIIDVWSFSDGTWFLSIFVTRSSPKVAAVLKTKG